MRNCLHLMLGLCSRLCIYALRTFRFPLGQMQYFISNVESIILTPLQLLSQSGDEMTEP